MLTATPAAVGGRCHHKSQVATLIHAKVYCKTSGDFKEAVEVVPK